MNVLKKLKKAERRDHALRKRESRLYVIQAAAPADFRPRAVAAEKIKKTGEGMAQVGAQLAQLEDTLPAMVIDALRGQLQRVQALSDDIEDIERKLALWKKEDAAAKRLMAIPGVGLLTATAAVATIGDAKVFKNGRQFAAFLGQVPRQAGTGGKVRLFGISKRGDTYLRKLLIHGARSVITHQKARAPWLEQLLARRPFNAAVVALANKMARTIWALLAHDRTYQNGVTAQAA